MLAVSGQDGGGVAPRLAGVPGLAQVRIDSANQCYSVKHAYCISFTISITRCGGPAPPDNPLDPESDYRLGAVHNLNDQFWGIAYFEHLVSV